MTVLPQVSGPRLVQALQKAGFLVKRQHGSHVILRHESDLSRRTVVPVHGSKTIKPGTLRAILKGTGLTADEVKQLLSLLIRRIPHPGQETLGTLLIFSAPRCRAASPSRLKLAVSRARLR